MKGLVQTINESLDSEFLVESVDNLIGDAVENNSLEKQFTDNISDYDMTLLGNFDKNFDTNIGSKKFSHFSEYVPFDDSKNFKHEIMFVHFDKSLKGKRKIGDLPFIVVTKDKFVYMFKAKK